MPKLWQCIECDHKFADGESCRECRRRRLAAGMNGGVTCCPSCHRDTDAPSATCGHPSHRRAWDGTKQNATAIAFMFEQAAEYGRAHAAEQERLRDRWIKRAEDLLE